MKKHITLTATVLPLAVSTAHSDEIPQDAKAYNNRELSYASIGEYDKVIEDYSKAIELNPQLAEE